MIKDDGLARLTADVANAKSPVHCRCILKREEKKRGEKKKKRHNKAKGKGVSVKLQ